MADSRAVWAGVLLAALLPLACQSSGGIYYWGEYEDSVHDVCLAESAVDLDAEILRITEIIDRAAERSRRVPPGLHAHLGYLYYLRGDVDGATAALLAEKEAYPESSVFIDGLLSRMKSAR